MRKIFLTVLFVFFISTSFADTPPSKDAMFPIQSITLNYDLTKSSLHVQAAHPSDNWERDYVRMMTVSLNGQVVSTLNYYHQTLPDGFSDDVQVNAQAGDVITVELFCTQGSSLSQDLTVAKEDSAQPDQSTNATTDNSAANE